MNSKALVEKKTLLSTRFSKIHSAVSDTVLPISTCLLQFRNFSTACDLFLAKNEESFRDLTGLNIIKGKG